jgi:hypothetical protein
MLFASRRLLIGGKVHCVLAQADNAGIEFYRGASMREGRVRAKGSKRK